MLNCPSIVWPLLNHTIYIKRSHTVSEPVNPDISFLLLHSANTKINYILEESCSNWKTINVLSKQVKSYAMPKNTWNNIIFWVGFKSIANHPLPIYNGDISQKLWDLLSGLTVQGENIVIGHVMFFDPL